MWRGLFLLALLSGAILMSLPFVLASRALDQRGVIIPGKVVSKDEYIAVLYSGWQRNRKVSVQYPLIENGGVSFLGLTPSESEFDAIHIGQTVPLHYLRRQDVPPVPFASVLHEMRILPRVREADKTSSSTLRSALTPQTLRGALACGLVVLVLTLWRLIRLTGFTVLVIATILTAIVLSEYGDFPLPVAQPGSNNRQARGRVKNLSRITKLFSGPHQEGLDASQPIDVLGMEFTPANWTSPVLGVDLIDSGSIAGLKEGTFLTLVYEPSSPRIIRIDKGTRNFVTANLRGIALQLVLVAIVTLVLLSVAFLFGRFYDRLVNAR